MFANPYPFRRLFLTIIAVFGSVFGVSGQVGFSVPEASFPLAVSNTADTLDIILNNTSTRVLDISGVKMYHTEFTISDSTFSIPVGGSASFSIVLDAPHNIDYIDYLYFDSYTHPGEVYLKLDGHVNHADSYYASTQNLWHEDLKAALKTRITTGYISMSYNDARDEMYMVIDNQKVNGEGAPVNTLEGVYTGTIASSYSSRSDAQTSFNFNTEHTFPQAFFSSSLPMQSDLHHIFPTWAPANSERGNKPFGYVSSPTWTNGGSKSSGSLFEPRDKQKPASAAAILYFATRYEDYSGFCASQEPALRDFLENYPPSSRDRKRNDDIYTVQNNRNPFIDHPEFLDRIASVCTMDAGETYARIHSLDELRFGSVSVGDTAWGLVPVSNQGFGQNLILASPSVSTAEFGISGTIADPISPDSIDFLQVWFAPTAASAIFRDTLKITSNDDLNPSIMIPLDGNSVSVDLDQVVSQPLEVDIRRLADHTHIDLDGESFSISVLDTKGKVWQSKEQVDHLDLEHSSLPAGVYILQIKKGHQMVTPKVVLY